MLLIPVPKWRHLHSITYVSSIKLASNYMYVLSDWAFVVVDAYCAYCHKTELTRRSMFFLVNTKCLCMSAYNYSL